MIEQLQQVWDFCCAYQCYCFIELSKHCLLLFILFQEDHSGYRNFLVSNCEDGNSCDQRISVSDHTNGLHHANSKSESVVLNMERFSHLLDKDVNANSRIAVSLFTFGYLEKIFFPPPNYNCIIAYFWRNLMTQWWQNCETHHKVPLYMTLFFD